MDINDKIQTESEQTEKPKRGIKAFFGSRHSEQRSTPMQRLELRREISRSMNRFLSILLIVMLGVAFFVGIRASEPDMLLSGDVWFDQCGLQDINVFNTVGMSLDDVDALAQIEGVTAVEGVRDIEAICLIDNNEHNMLLREMTEQTNKPMLTEGRLPEAPDECLLDAFIATNLDIGIGSTLSVVKVNGELEDTLTRYDFTVVGLCDYADYISWERGSSSLGNGRIELYAVLPSSAFALDYYTSVHVSCDQLDELNCFSDEYCAEVDTVVSRIEQIADERIALRDDYVRSTAAQKLADGRKELEEAEVELNDARQQLEDARAELESGEATINKKQRELEAGSTKLEDAERQINDGQKQLDEAKAKFNAEKKELEDSGLIYFVWSEIEKAQTQIDEAQAELNAKKRELEKGRTALVNGRSQLESAIQELKEGRKKLEEGEAELAKYEDEFAAAQKKLEDGETDLANLAAGHWYVLPRDESLQVYIEYQQNTERVGALGKVFPVVFFLVAALVSLTTMTRMINEQRGQIGTLKALGYSRRTILRKYILYALAAASVGCLLGVLLGSNLLPRIVMDAYAILYQSLPVRLSPINIGISVMAVVLALLCTLGAIISVGLRTTGEVTAQLMRPQAPKAGKRTLLEKNRRLWAKLNFGQKAAYRNLCRYKKRFWMTVIGVAGCTALLLVGFGLHDAINGMTQRQCYNIWTYDAVLTLDENINADSLSERLLRENDVIIDANPVSMTSCTVGHNSVTREAYLFVPEQVEHMDEYMDLHERVSGDPLPLTDDGAVISEKLSMLLDLQVGDHITLHDDSRGEIDIPIAGISENYLFHFVFLSASLYEKLYGYAPNYTTIYLHCEELDEAGEEQLRSDMLAQEEIIGVECASNMRSRIDEMLGALDLVIWVLIISAALLDFVVVYNLNNIAIMEHRRELATIRVLGFYDGELAWYIYRENAVLTLLGGLLGLGLGVLLQRFVIGSCEVDVMMFARDISLLSFVWSLLLTFVFSAAVNLSMYNRICGVDMVESLKSVE